MGFDKVSSPQSLEPRISSSLLSTRADGTQAFIHDNLRDFFLASWFAEHINSGQLSIEDAYRDYWSYVEDKELWGLADLANDGCRAILPAWKNVLSYLLSQLNLDNQTSMMQILTFSYFNARPILEENTPLVEVPLSEHYKFSNKTQIYSKPQFNVNPFLDDFFFVSEQAIPYRETLQESLFASYTTELRRLATYDDDDLASTTSSLILFPYIYRKACSIYLKLTMTDDLYTRLKQLPHSHSFLENEFDQYYRSFASRYNLPFWVALRAHYSEKLLNVQQGNPIPDLFSGNNAYPSASSMRKIHELLQNPESRDTISGLLPYLMGGVEVIDGDFSQRISLVVFDAISFVHRNLKPKGYNPPEKRLTS